MKIDKEKKKELKDLIKKCAKIQKMKHVSSSFYNVYDNTLLICTYDITDRSVIFSLEMKKLEYDDILWNILDMKSNIEEPMSLRVNGAYTCPSFKLESCFFLHEDDKQSGQVEAYITSIENRFKNFVAANDIEKMIIEKENMYHGDVLKCCMLISNNKVDEACEIARQGIGNNDSGGFIIGDKTFFQLLLEKYN